MRLITHTTSFHTLSAFVQRHPDRSAILALVCLSLLTRLLFLGHPGSAVFDEVHFNYFAGFYYSGQYYYDIHPPLGKLLIAAAAYPMGGIAPEDIVRQISVDYPSDVYLAMRAWPALVGSTIPLLLFAVARELRISVAAAFTVAMLAVFDNALLIQSRLILLDAMLLGFGFAALWLFLRARRTQTTWLFLLSAFFAGCSLSVKWIGVSFLGVIGLTIIFDWLRDMWLNGRRLKLFYLGSAYLAISVSTYVLMFFIHFSLLPLSHQQGDQFMSADFQSTLQGSRYQGATGTVEHFQCPPQYQHSLSYGMANTDVKPMEALACKVRYKPLTSPHFFAKLVELNITMYTTNQGLSQSHPDASPWYSWPIMYKPLYYWHHEGARIYHLGNPLVWLLSALAVVALILGQFHWSQWRQNEAFWILMTGFWASLLPFMMVSRVMFMYHYLTSLCFALILSGYLLDRLRPWPPVKPLWLGGALLSFLLISPLTYGINWFGSDMLWFLRVFGWHP